MFISDKNIVENSNERTRRQSLQKSWFGNFSSDKIKPLSLKQMAEKYQKNIQVRTLN